MTDSTGPLLERIARLEEMLHEERTRADYYEGMAGEKGGQAARLPGCPVDDRGWPGAAAHLSMRWKCRYATC